MSLAFGGHIPPSRVYGFRNIASPTLKQEDNPQHKGHAESLSPSLFYKSSVQGRKSGHLTSLVSPSPALTNYFHFQAHPCKDLLVKESMEKIMTKSYLVLIGKRSAFTAHSAVNF